MAEAFGIACHELVSLDFRYGSRLCKNSDAETFRATIESGRQRGRIIIAAEANFMTQYFVSVAKKIVFTQPGSQPEVSDGHENVGYRG